MRRIISLWRQSSYSDLLRCRAGATRQSSIWRSSRFKRAEADKPPRHFFKSAKAASASAVDSTDIMAQAEAPHAAEGWIGAVEKSRGTIKATSSMSVKL